MRPPTKPEMDLLRQLFAQAQLEEDMSSLVVCSMSDGGMGSLAIGLNHDSRQFGSCVAELELKDTDGVRYIASLYLDNSGSPYELDIFKADFSETRALNANS